MPAVTTLCMDTAVAAFAQRYKVIPRMRTALGQRHDVMHLLNWHDNPTPEAFLAERIFLHITCADTAPCSSIPTAYSRIPVILFVACVFLFLMFLAVPSVRQVRTARMGTRPLWFVRHKNTSSFITKAPRGFASREASYQYHFAFRYHNNIT